MAESTLSEAARVERPTRAENRPVAVPWVLGLYGLAGATFVVAAHMARWYGGAQTAWLLAPLVVLLGITVLLAGMWAYEARDALGTAILGTWGAFWIAYGLLNALFATGRLAEPKGASPELGFWFIALAVTTWMGTIAAFGESLGLVAAFGTLAAGSTIAVFAELLGSGGLTILAGWLLILAAVCGWYAATGMLFEETFGRRVLPLGVAGANPAPRIGAEGPSPLRQSPAAQRAG